MKQPKNDQSGGSRRQGRLLPRRGPIATRHLPPARAVVGAVVALMALEAAFGQGTGSRPGTKDPIGKPANYSMFRDDEFAVAIPSGSTVNLNTYLTDSNLNATASSALSVQGPLSSGYQIFAAAGRVFDPNQDRLAYAQRGSDGSSVAVQFFTTNGPATYTLPGSILQPQVSDASDFLAFALADLDKLPDSEGVNHDEAIVCYASPAGASLLRVNLAVLNYTTPDPDPTQPRFVTTATASHSISSSSFLVPSGSFTFASSNILAPDNVLSLAVGDFDGDGQNEIAVAALQDGQTLYVTMFRYTNTGTNPPTLTEVSSRAVSPNQHNFSSINLAAADLDGDGKDELVIGESDWDARQVSNPLGGTYTAFTFFGVFSVFQSDPNLNLTFKSAGVPLATGYYAAFYPYSRVQVVPGLFQFDPSNPGSFKRRQIALGFNGYGSRSASAPLVTIRLYSVSTNLATISQMGSDIYLELINSTFSLAAGGFVGNANPQSPVWSLAVNVDQSSGPISGSGKGSADRSVTYLINPASNAVASALVLPLPSTPPGNDRLPVVAFDADGDSMYLGAPTHFVVSSLPQLDFVLQEPPKHAWYDQASGLVRNVSRVDGFYVALTDSKGINYNTTSTDSTSQSFGGRAGVNVSLAFGFKREVGIGDVAAISVDVNSSNYFAFRSAYNYQANQSTLNSSYASRQVQVENQTTKDDHLQGRFQTFDLWRYRVYGSSLTDVQSNSANVFYDLLMPGPSVTFYGGGLNFDWYQPVHENGNILSYPQFYAAQSPSDLGDYTLNGLNSSEPFISGIQQFVDGNVGSIGLTYQNGFTSGSTLSSQSTFNYSLDVASTWGTEFKPFGASLFFKATGSFGFDNAYSWANSTTANRTQTSSTGITLQKPQLAGSSATAYAFYPTFYLAENGTGKVTHNCDVAGSASGRNFWATIYGRQYDPALNLPLRFVPHYVLTLFEGWRPNVGASRKQIRGFFLRRYEPNEVTGGYDLLTQAPNYGDRVRMAVRVYNYSTGQSFSGLTVRFEAIAFDPSTQIESGPRIPIGETIVPFLGPLGVTEAEVVWDTAATVPAPAIGAYADYRIYVVLDPDNTLPGEIYESEDPNRQYPGVDRDGNPLPVGVDPGQNNEGWGLAELYMPLVSQPPGVGRAPQAKLLKDALAARARNGKLKTKEVTAEFGQPIELRVDVQSDVTDPGYYTVLLYDGDPLQDGELIAQKFVRGLSAQTGRFVWLGWIPTRLGRHDLFAQVIEPDGAPTPSNDAATLKVQVVNPPKK